MGSCGRTRWPARPGPQVLVLVFGLQSKMISNQIPYPTLKTKREITKYINRQQFTKGTSGKPNEKLFPRQVVIQLPKYITHIIGEPKYKYGQQGQVTVTNHNRSTALERSVLKYWGRGGGA